MNLDSEVNVENPVVPLSECKKYFIRIVAKIGLTFIYNMFEV